MIVNFIIIAGMLISFAVCAYAAGKLSDFLDAAKTKPSIRNRLYMNDLAFFAEISHYIDTDTCDFLTGTGEEIAAAAAADKADLAAFPAECCPPHLPADMEHIRVYCMYPCCITSVPVYPLSRTPHSLILCYKDTLKDTVSAMLQQGAIRKTYE
ncbi:MAG: hypothetical protein IJ120_05495 [Solobacterium sp.]|nr:hypothetical protein [Solobacterium sp.]